MYCDVNGRPDPHGRYQIIDGKVAARRMLPGEHISFDMAFIDSKPAANRVFLTDTTPTFNDAERKFADSAEGQETIAYAKAKHALGGGRCGQWNDQMERRTIAAAVAPNAARSTITDASMADAKAQEDAAYLRSVAALNRPR